MKEGKRQKQIGGLIQEEINIIFQKMGLHMMENGMVSVSSVKLTPDLLEARIYLSIFNIPDKNGALSRIEEKSWQIKKEMASKLKQQLRRIPEIRFFLDDTLEQVFKMEELLRAIKTSEDNSPSETK